MKFIKDFKSKIDSAVRVMQSNGTSKGQFAGLSAGAVGIGVLVVTLGMMALVLAGVQDSTTADSYAYNISADGLGALDSMAGFVAPLAIVIIASLIILVLRNSNR